MLRYSIFNKFFIFENNTFIYFLVEIVMYLLLIIDRNKKGVLLPAIAGLRGEWREATEKIAAQLRGQGVALFREEVAKGMSQAAKEMQNASLDASFILFSMWTESIKHFAEQGKGNVIFLDGSAVGMENTMRQIQALMVKHAGVDRK